MLRCFWGANELARTEAVNALKAAVPADLRDLNIATLDGRVLKLAALITACDAFPVLHDRRLVLVQDAVKSLRPGKDRDGLLAYLPNVPATTDLVFVEGDDWDKRSAIFGLLKKIGEVTEFKPHEGAELIRWLQSRARTRGATLVPEAAQLLVNYVGDNGRALLNEVEKLATFVGPGERIDAGAVRLLVYDASESSVFNFVDALAARRLGPALLLLRDLMEQGEAPTYLLFMIARHIRLLLAVSDLQAARKRPEEIAATLKQQPFVVRKALDQTRHFSQATLVALHDRLVELDHWSKTGRIEGPAALQLLVAEACT